MSVVIPPGFVRVSYGFTITGDPEEMFVTSAFGMAAPPNELTAAGLYQAFAENFKAQASDETTFTRARLEVGQDGGPPIVIEHVGTTSGTSTAAFTPVNVCYLIKKGSQTPGREGRGRLYLPFVREAIVDQVGILDNPAIADLSNAAQLWLGASIAVDNVDAMVILHNSATPPSVVTSLFCDRKVATQRRRLRP